MAELKFTINLLLFKYMLYFIDETLQIKRIESDIVSLCHNLIQNAFRHTAPYSKIQVSWQKSLGNEACFDEQRVVSVDPNDK